MASILKSNKIAALLLMVSIVTIVAVFKSRSEWWSYADVFFVFMAAFSHLMAVSLEKMSPRAGRLLDRIAIVCFVLAFIAFIVILMLLKSNS